MSDNIYIYRLYIDKSVFGRVFICDKITILAIIDLNGRYV